MSEDQLYCEALIFLKILFLQKLRRIFSEKIQWSEDTPSKRRMPTLSKRCLSTSCSGRYNLDVLKSYLRGCRSVVFFLFLDNLMFRHASLFLSEKKSTRCSLFPFSELCKQNLSFPFFPIWKFMFPLMTRICFFFLSFFFFEVEEYIGQEKIVR